jgi:uncharacterized protein
MSNELVKVSLYINEADEWHHRPAHIAILVMLREEGLAGGTVLHAVAGFTLKEGVHTTHLVDAGGKVPLVIDFIDTEEKVKRVMPKLREMVPHRLIVRQAVVNIVKDWGD